MEDRIQLPSPSYRGTRTLEEVLAKRRSNRSFLDREIEQAAIGQLMWAGQGIRDRLGKRTAPSEGGRYPLDLYLAKAIGVSQYLPQDHALQPLFDDDVREALYAAALYQDSLKQVPLVIVITAELARAEHQYGEERAERFVLIEAGHVAQNMLLQAYAMGLAGVAFGAFKDEQIAEALRLPAERIPLYILAIGYSLG